MIKPPPIEDQTNNYYNNENKEYFCMAYKKLFNASHWVDPYTGEEVKLTHNIKAVYIHKMDQYNSFTKKGLKYKESHQTVADKIGVSLKVVDEVAIPLLKRMGLVEIERINLKTYYTTMIPLKYIKGWLINKKLAKHNQRVKKPVNKDPITYEQLKIIEKNKQKIKRIRDNMKEEYFILTKADMERLKRGE